jgi:hypothetical protein
MYTDTTELIDETIAQLRTLQGVFAEDFHLCRRTGLSHDARQCSEALEAISLLLPRLQMARATQDPAGGRLAGNHCPNCD